MKHFLIVLGFLCFSEPLLAGGKWVEDSKTNVMIYEEKVHPDLMLCIGFASDGRFWLVFDCGDNSQLVLWINQAGAFSFEVCDNIRYRLFSYTKDGGYRVDKDNYKRRLRLPLLMSENILKMIITDGAFQGKGRTFEIEQMFLMVRDAMEKMQSLKATSKEDIAAEIMQAIGACLETLD